MLFHYMWFEALFGNVLANCQLDCRLCQSIVWKLWAFQGCRDESIEYASALSADVALSGSDCASLPCAATNVSVAVVASVQ